MRRSIDSFLHDDETLLHVYRPSALTLVRPLGLVVLILLAMVFLFFPLKQLGTPGLWIFFVVCVCVVLRALHCVYLWQRNCTLVTNRRVVDIDRRGLFEKYIAEAPLEQICDIRYNQKGVLATVATIGDVIVDLGNARGRLEIQRIRFPHRVKEELMALHRHHTKKTTPTQDDAQEEEITEL